MKALCSLGAAGLDHAGEAESAFALHWAPAHVAMEETASHAAAPAGGSAFDWPVELDPARNGNAASRFASSQRHRRETAPDGAVGDPRQATAAQGKAMIEAVARNLAALIEELRQTRPDPAGSGIPI